MEGISRLQRLRIVKAIDPGAMPQAFTFRAFGAFEVADRVDTSPFTALQMGSAA